MKCLCVPLILSIACVRAVCGQQAQPVANALHDDNPQNSQPILHGEAQSSIQANAAQNASQPEGLRNQLLSLQSYLAGRRGFIEIPPGAAPGWWPGFGDSSIRILDDRGTSNPDVNGQQRVGTLNGYKVAYSNGILFRATETDPSSPDHYTGFMNVQFHYNAARGGLNNYIGKSGTKTDYFNILATSEMRTVGQKTAIGSRLNSYSSGDTMGLATSVTQFGGWDTSGDEQTEGLRIQAQQGSAGVPGTGGVFKGVVSAISGHTLTYSPVLDETTLGEHRILRDLDRAYKAGSIVSIANLGGNPNTVHVTGSGTHWSELGRKSHTQWNNLAAGGGVTSTTLAFCFDPIRGDGYDACFPVSEVVDDTHLTLNLVAYGTGQNTSWPASWPTAGSYTIYGAAWPTSVDMDAHTITAPDLSGISAGHNIDQVLAYNMQVIGAWIALSRHIGIPGKGAGVHILNWGNAGSPTMDFGVGVSGGFESAYTLQASNQRSGVPRFFATLYDDPTAKILIDSSPARSPAPQVALWRARDSSGAAHLMLSFVRDTATTCLIDSSLCVSASGGLSTKQLGQAEANDYAGVISIRSGSSASISFQRPFHSNPVCSLTPTSDPSKVGTYWVTTTTSSVSANIHEQENISFNYICVGNPN